MEPPMKGPRWWAALVALAGVLAAAGSCGETKTGAAMATTAADQRALCGRIDGLPELELPDGWYQVPESVAIPGRWASIAALEPAGPSADALRAKYANGGRPFKHSVLSNMPGPRGLTVTVVSPGSGAFVRVDGEELERLKAGTLPATRAAEILRVAGAE